ncbi:MAG: hypothetical protein AB7P76_00160 [Candidatus Melainabacteria bacterium]
MDNGISQLIQLNLILFVPVALLLAVLLYKLVMLLHRVNEFMTVAQYELSPLLQETRLTVSHLETLSAKAVQSVNAIERGVEATRPTFSKGAEGLKAVSSGLKMGVSAVGGALFNGLLQSFTRRKA